MARQRYLAGRRVAATRERYTGKTTAPPVVEKPQEHGLQHLLEQGLTDLKDVAVNAPAGVYYLGKGLATDPLGTVKQVGASTLEDLRHPLRHPGYTFLDVLGIAGGAAGIGARVAATGRALKAGEAAADVARAATRRPVFEPRTLHRGGLEVKTGSSQSPLGAIAQRATDKALHASAEKRPGGIADRLLTRKIGKVVTAEARTIQDVHKAPGAALIALGRKLSPAEQKALQVVAEEAPLESRITATSARVTGARDQKTRGRHQAELDLLHSAKPLIDETGGKPAFTGDDAAKLNRVLDRMREVAGSREELLKTLGQLTDESVQGRKSKAGRVAIGEPLAEGTLRLDQAGNPVGIEHATADVLHAQLGSIESDYQKLLEQAMGGKPGDYKRVTAIQNMYAQKLGRKGIEQPTVRDQLLSEAEKTVLDTMRRNPEHPTVKAWQQKLEAADAIRAELSRRGDVSLGFEKARELPSAAALFEASPAAVRIPDVARKPPRSLGRPGGVGTGGTIGHLRAPGSTTHEYTGALREHAVRREDTTALVGESGMEAARFAGLLHVHELVRQAATPEPTSAGDIAVRLDDLKSHERLPLDVRKFVDAPEEFFSKATPDQTASAFEQVRQRLIIDPKKLDAEAAAEFQRLHAQGKIGFVPRAMLGELAKPHIPIRNKAVSSVDTINNASRFAILYLKPAYAIPNLLGNAALNVLQQGFAAVPNLSRAVRLNGQLGPELAARIDALMGEGFARAISAHGQGRLAGVVDTAASVWSKGVDTPFRRSSFLFEAHRAGFKTPAELEQLLTRGEHQEKLVEVTQRANREIIDYANLSPAEREVIRRVVFFYPWVKGSTVYAGRILREHPVKAAVIGQVGQKGKENAPEAPSYLQGVFDVGGKLVNPTSAAILQTPAQVGQAAAGLAGGDVGEVGMLSNFLSPAAALAVAAATRRNRGGYQYPAGAGLGEIAFDQLVKNTPQFTLGQRISDASHGRGQDRLYPPNIRDAILQYVVGGIAPRKYNRDKLLELAASERSRYVP